MPELPEVETVRKILLQWCKNKTIKDIELIYPKVIENSSFEEFKNNILNKKIDDITRLGKYLFFKMDDYVLISHLRMEGKYFFLKDGEEESEYIKKHKIISFKLDDGILIYHDVRKFGKMKVVNSDKYMLDKSVSKLGKEPFYLTPQELHDKLKNSTKKIKQSLLDQSIVCGMGNIYVDEVLFDCKILPTRICKEVTYKECEAIISSSVKILNRAIELKGSTIATYHFNNNESGGFQNEHKVYGKKGNKCLRCGEIISKTVVAGRGTYYCNNCQK